MQNTKNFVFDDDFFPRPRTSAAASIELRIDGRLDRILPSAADQLLIPRVMPSPDAQTRSDMSSSPLLARAMDRLAATFAERPYEETPDPHLINGLTDARKAVAQWISDNDITTVNMTAADFRHPMFPLGVADSNVDTVDFQDVLYQPNAQLLATNPSLDDMSRADLVPQPARARAAPRPSEPPEEEGVYLTVVGVAGSNAFDLHLAWKSAKGHDSASRPRTHEHVFRLDPMGDDLLKTLREAQNTIGGRTCWCWHPPDVFMKFSKALATPEARGFEPLHEWLRLRSVRVNATVIYKIDSQSDIDHLSMEDLARRFNLMEEPRLYKSFSSILLMKVRRKILQDHDDLLRGKAIPPLVLADNEERD